MFKILKWVEKWQTECKKNTHATIGKFFLFVQLEGAQKKINLSWS